MWVCVCERERERERGRERELLTSVAISRHHNGCIIQMFYFFVSQKWINLFFILFFEMGHSRPLFFILSFQ